MKKLPIGIQTFAKIREDDFVYVDKTPLIYQMVQSAGAFFLSRPRRFGKSLLVDTLKELFEGNQAWFQGLFIEDKWDWAKTYPVVHLNFSDVSVNNAESLANDIQNILEINQQRLELVCKPHHAVHECLRELIISAHQTYAKKVVVLVDEYDKPILDNIDQPETAAEIRDLLKSVYSVLKAQDAHLQFVFMTGVTKFSKVSLFSGMNQLKDITLDARYATICGYTQSDLHNQFAEHLEGVDWAKLKDWYNGYQFLGEPVYNPYDILLFISENHTYRNHWFETGNPSFLLKLFRKQRYFLPDLAQIEVGEEVLDSFDVEQINPITLLYQAGYLTIAKTTEKRQRLRFHLKVPNFEVQQALSDHFADLYSQTQPELRLHRQDSLYDAFESADFLAIQHQIESLFAAIPWRNFTQNDLPDAEGYYASVLFAWLSSINAVIAPEDINNHGQADMTIMLGDHIYVTEFKLDKSENYQPQSPNPALQQIQTKNYAQKYLAQQQAGKQIHQLGLIFNTHARNLVQIDWQSL